MEVDERQGTEGGCSISSGDGGTQATLTAAEEEVTMEMLKRGSSQKEGRARTQMSDCSSRGTLETACSRPSGSRAAAAERTERGAGAGERLNSGFVSSPYP